MPQLARYAPGLRRLHWLMAVLIALAYILIEQRGLFERGTAARAAMVQSHFWVGIALLLLALWRLRLRWVATIPPITPVLPTWQSAPAKLLHLALYAFIIVQPLLGWPLHGPMARRCCCLSPTSRCRRCWRRTSRSPTSSRTCTAASATSLLGDRRPRTGCAVTTTSCAATTPSNASSEVRA